MKNILKGLFKKDESKKALRINKPKLLSEVLEYHYIDLNRLNRYFEQLTPEKKTQELLSAKTTLGITKVETEMTASDYIVEYNLSEKVLAILNAYRSEFPIYTESSEIQTKDPVSGRLPKFLYFEGVRANQIVIPIKNKVTSEKKNIKIWVSFCDNYTIYAMEDEGMTLSDDSHRLSGFSATQFFSWSENTRDEITPKVLQYLPSLEKTKSELDKIGGTITSERTINLLGITRLIFSDQQSIPIYKAGVICYPIIITS